MRRPGPGAQGCGAERAFVATDPDRSASVAWTRGRALCGCRLGAPFHARRVVTWRAGAFGALRRRASTTGWLGSSPTTRPVVSTHVRTGPKPSLSAVGSRCVTPSARSGRAYPRRSHAGNSAAATPTTTRPTLGSAILPTLVDPGAPGLAQLDGPCVLNLFLVDDRAVARRRSMRCSPLHPAPSSWVRLHSA